MNNDNGANDANDNANGRNVGLPEMKRQELLQQRLEFEQEQQRLLQE